MFKHAIAYKNRENNQTTNLVQFYNVRRADGSLIAGNRYSYDNMGNITAIKQSTGSYFPLVSYNYDGQGQLISEKFYDGNGTGESHITDSYTYTYDTAGNILSVKKNGATIKSYTYSTGDWKDLLTAVDGSPIVYEGQTYSGGIVSGTAISGNPIRYTNDTQTYTNLTWQHGRQLTSLTTNGETYTYDYDVDGIRTRKIIDGAYHNYVTQNGKVVRETVQSGDWDWVLDFIYDNGGRPFALKYSYDGGNNFETYYYILNLQGDVVALMDTSGTVIARYTYNAWGEILSATGEMAETNPLRYRGYYYDSETGFYYLQSRYYDPVNCRFINADVYASTGIGFFGFNMFAYCNNRPIVLRDSNGIAPVETIDIDGNGTIDCYVYEYSYSGYAPLGMGTSLTVPVSGNGKIYIFDGDAFTEDYITDPQNYPEGFNPNTDFMARYYIEKTKDERSNYVIQIANSYKCRIEVQMRAVAKELRSFGAQYKRSWKRSEDSIVTEWKEHNRYALFSDTAKHTDFDTAEEGRGFFYFLGKAIERALF